VFYWLDRFDVSETNPQEQLHLENRVLGILKPDRFMSPVDIGDAIQEIPWAVLDACRGLVKSKRAIEGIGPRKGSFRKV
jgi:hypothetical protein